MDTQIGGTKVDRYCTACDPYFKVRRDLIHTLEAPGCKHGGPNITPRPWTEPERKRHDYVEQVSNEIDRIKKERKS